MLVIMVIALSGCTSQQISSTLGTIMNNESLTTDEVVAGLKEALVQGTSKGTNTASKQDGYFRNIAIKILFPPDAQKVETKLRQIGLGSEVDKFVLALNRGAELAAKEAKPIFVGAIKSMTIEDAWSILKGEQNAATQYLQRTTSAELQKKFQPIIQNSLQQVNATKYYGDLVNTYNKIPLVKRVNPDLDAYATEKAIEGLFHLVAKEEANIRANPVARTTDLLEKVFAETN